MEEATITKLVATWVDKRPPNPDLNIYPDSYYGNIPKEDLHPLKDVLKTGAKNESDN